MIYLKPFGGLCNRMRTIDSLIKLCQIHNEDLTILWVNDSALNCSFSSLFQIPCFDKLNFKVLDCPVGFPDNYIRISQSSKISTSSKLVESILRKSKNALKGRFLNDRLEQIIKIIKSLNDKSILIDEELAVVFELDKYGPETSAREMDAAFMPKAKPMVDSLFSNATPDAYLTTCFRVHPLKDRYEHFIPTTNLSDRVEHTVQQFDDTIGLHIRRSDHKASKEVSTTSKFIAIIEDFLRQNGNSTFFLSTDDGETKAKLIEQYGKRILFNEISSYDRNSSAAVKDALVDLYCLSNTKIIYGSHHSSFSQTAADIGGIKEFTAK